MSKKATLCLLALVAVFATLAGHPQASGTVRAWSEGGALKRRSAANQLPQGFVLPASDVDLKVLSLVAADVDADGDLDIVAAEGSNGEFSILVWVNDGDGRLIRKAPAQPRSLQNEPPSPSFEHHAPSVSATVQPTSPAIEATRASGWLTTPPRLGVLPFSPAPNSATLAGIRPRSPPSLA